tara:strand:- start:1061 stop:1174 length:114 start_codon:yes stop_codon:yes gene_type:complete
MKMIQMEAVSGHSVAKGENAVHVKAALEKQLAVRTQG